MKWLRWLGVALAEADNRTPSIFRALAFSLSVHVAVIASWQVWVMGEALDFTSYAGALAMLWAGAGVGERVAGRHTPGAYDYDEGQE